MSEMQNHVYVSKKLSAKIADMIYINKVTQIKTFEGSPIHNEDAINKFLITPTQRGGSPKEIIDIKHIVVGGNCITIVEYYEWVTDENVKRRSGTA